jgi:peptide/nickel transport system ATP-binding protein
VALLRLNSFSVGFKQTNQPPFLAVNGIQLELEKGQITGLIGESGSGKSVASQSITRLIESAIVKGNAIFNNGDVEIDLLHCEQAELVKIRKRYISYIFQEPMTALNPLIRCGKQILECAEFPSSELLQSLLEKVELFDWERIASSYPHELSGGQRQRIMIAMALAKEPLLLIADEPTTALDVAVQNDILKLLTKLCKESEMAILFITHDLISLKNFADQIAVMYRGNLVEKGSAESILNKPNHPYTKALLQSRARYDKRGFKLAEIDHLLSRQNEQLQFVEYKSEELVKDKAGEEEILRLSEVSKSHFKSGLFSKVETQVLKNINFNICQGDIVGLIGESGSGKSTIAKLILKIWDTTSGSILLKYKNLKDEKDLSKEIQLVFQDPYSSLNPKQKIGSALVEVLASTKAKDTKQKAIALLNEVGLQESDFNKYPHEFSGGQRQRVCIAKALAKNPKVIVLDEAVSALDVSVQAKILNLLNQLKREKKLTYLLISHDMNVVSYFCNKIVVLKNGEIVEIGNTEELVSNPSSQYTKSLLEHSIN